MMTKDVSTTGSASPADALSLTPGPAPAKSTKPEREFSSVMDQAAGRKPAHARATRSSSRGRGGEPEPATDRERLARASRNDSNARPVSRSAKPPVKVSATEAEDNRPVEKATTAAESKSVSEVAPTDENVPAEESADTEEVSSGDNSPAAETPANIVPFPGQMPPTAVIIPFPLLEAQSAAAKRSSPGTAASGVGSAAGSAALESSTPTNSGNVIVPLPAARAVTTSRVVPEGGRMESDDSDGIDVGRLGLRPVTSNEPVETSPANIETAGPASEAPAVTGDVEAKIVSVSFRPAANESARERGSRVLGGTQTQLPGEPARRVESAPSAVLSESSAKIVLLRTDAAKAATDGAASAPGTVNARPPEITGTSVARQEVRMESTTTAGREAATAEQGDDVLVRLPELAGKPGEQKRTMTERPVQELTGRDWPSDRLLNENEVLRSEPSSAEVQRTDSTGSVERISNLIVREAALVRKHGSDSMAVVLRPDAETELFVHLSQNNGQIEATIRCERGDAHQIGALWSQLQESLAQQKIRLAPLQETSGGNSNFNQSSGGPMTGGGQNGAREEARPEKQSMDDWPAPAVPVINAPHVRGTGGSRRRRITTSRPGWETWA